MSMYYGSSIVSKKWRLKEVDMSDESARSDGDIVGEETQRDLTSMILISLDTMLNGVLSNHIRDPHSGRRSSSITILKTSRV